MEIVGNEAAVMPKIGLFWLVSMPGHIVIGQEGGPLKEFCRLAQREHKLEKLVESLIFFAHVPEEIIELIVLAVGIVIAIARVSIFVCHEHHRGADTEEQRRYENCGSAASAAR